MVTPSLESIFPVSSASHVTRMERWLSSRRLAYGLFALIYIVPTLILAHRKLMWEDELFTLYLSKIGTWSELIRALSTGADQHPPSFYYLTHLIFQLAGTTHVTLRVAAVAGFGLGCASLYEISRRLVGAKWATSAFIFPLASGNYYYASEARGYGLEVGFATFALLMWILAAEGKKRRLTLPGLAFGLCGAVASHYYAVLIVIPLVVGELVRTWFRKSVDFAVWVAFAASAIPLVAFAPVILKARTYSGHFWAVPHWGEPLFWYPDALGHLSLLLVATAAVGFLLRLLYAGPDKEEEVAASLPISAAIIVWALIPMIGIVLAESVTHAYTGRYFIAALTPVCFLLIFALKRILPSHSIGAGLVLVLTLGLYAQAWRDQFHTQNTSHETLLSSAALLRSTGTGPVIVSEATIFHQISYYAKSDLAERVVYVADPYLSTNFIGHDTIDRGLLDLKPWFPLNVVWWHDWWKDHSSSLIYGNVGEWTWITFALPQIADLKISNRDLSHLMMLATRLKVPEDDRSATDPSGKPALYDQLQRSGHSLCEIYMPTETCPVVDDPKFRPFIAYPNIPGWH